MSIKKRFFAGIVSFLTACSLFAGQICPVLAEEDVYHTDYYYTEPETNAVKGWREGPNIEAQAAVLMDLSTEAILYSKNPDVQLYPASITKVLTCLIACEHLDLDAVMTMSQEAAFGIEAGSSSIYADTGEVFTVTQALMALMLESANEMALALGEEVSGSSKKFVELMNRRAAELGCKSSHFNNPNGLPDETHYTTANDMAKIAKGAWMNEEFRRFVTTNYYEIPPTNIQTETRYLSNHHKMMEGKERAYEGVLGGKTGYTVAAGNTLITYAKRGNTTLAAVVLNSIGGAYDDTAALLDFGFSNFEYQTIKEPLSPPAANNLPYLKYVMKDCGNISAFDYERKMTVSVPEGTNLKKLTHKAGFLENAIGPMRIKHKYYLDKHMVGWGMQYEKDILSDLLL